MGLFSLLSSAAWLFITLIVTLIRLGEQLLGFKSGIVSTFSGYLVSAMVPFISRQTLDRLRDVLSFGGPKIISGSKADIIFLMPVFQRSDGVTLKLGYMVTREEDGVMFTIRNIMVRADLKEVTVTIIPVEEKSLELRDEEMVCGIDEVQAVMGKNVVLDVARDGMDSVVRSIANSPENVQVLILILTAV